MGPDAARGSWLSFLGWVAPVALIVGGLAFLAADNGDEGVSGDSATPANAADAARRHATSFVTARAPDGATAQLAGLVPVHASADGPSLYHLRMVVVSHETLPETPRTVAFCVAWDVDVSAGAVAELGAVELSTDRGTHPADQRAREWRERCALEPAL